MKKNLKNIIAVAILLCVFVVAYCGFKSYFIGFENEINDLKIKYSTPQGFFGKTFSAKDDNIVIINIDDIIQYELSKISPSKYAPWPWSRNIWSNIINYLETAKPKVILLDEIFEGYEDTSLSAYSNDGIFAKTLSKYDNIILSTHLTSKLGDKNTQSDSENDENPYMPMYKEFNIISSNSNIEKNITYLSYSQIPDLFITNTEIAANNLPLNNNSGIKYFQPIYKLTTDTQSYFIPSLAFAGAIKYLNVEDDIILGKNEITFGKYKIPINKNGQIQINPKGGISTYTTIPISSVIQAQNSNSRLLKDGSKTIPVDYLKGKIIIISDTIKNRNLLSTPFSNRISSAEINATIIDNIINDADSTSRIKRNFVYEFPSYANFLITLLLFSVICLIGARVRNNFAYLSLTLAVIAIYPLINAILFYYPDFRYNIAVIQPVYFMLCAYICTSILKTLNNMNKYSKINDLYGNYVSKGIKNQLMQTKNLQLDKTLNTDLTVLICDIKNFSTYCENYAPQVLMSKVNELFNLVADEVYKNNGAIYKFIEDSVIAYWGAPITSSDDAYNGVKCAIAIEEKLNKNKIMLDDTTALEIKIAVNTGKSLVGCVKTDKITEYNIIGDGLNYAKKIEKICSMTEKSILISEKTYNATKMKIQSNYKGEMKIKGKDEKIKVYEPVGIIKG